MNWKTKALIQIVLSRIPFGREIHRKLQDIAGTTRPDIQKHFKGRLQIINQMQKYGIRVEGSSFMEIGTGWHPVVPILLYLFDAQKITTIDINPWLNRKSLAETIDMIYKVINDISASCGIGYDDILSKLDTLRMLNDDTALSVDEVLQKVNIQYVCPMDASNTSFRDREYDCVMSYTVLQCIPQDIIRGIFTESHRILKTSGWNVHHIFTGDPFGCDPGISTLNFLKYPDSLWYWIGGSGLAHNNRLRCADYTTMLNDTNFEIKHTIVKQDEKALNALESGILKVAPEFSGYDYNELACTSLDVFAQKT